MSTTKLSRRARRIVEAGKLLHGDEWMTAFANEVGVSKQLLSFIAAGKQPVSDKTDRKVLAALNREAVRLRKAADRLDEIVEMIRVRFEY